MSDAERREKARLRSECCRHMSIEEQGFLSPDIAAYIAKYRAENKAWFDHATDLNSIAQQLLREFQGKDDQTLWAALLFVRSP